MDKRETANKGKNKQKLKVIIGGMIFIFLYFYIMFHKKQ